MAKRLVIIGFLICFGLACWTYWSRDKKSLRENLSARLREPRIVMDEFSLYRYQGEKIKARVMAKFGYFYEPNLVELDGEIRGERLNTDGTVETVNAETATALFSAKTLGSMLGQKVKLERADLTSFVEVGVKNHLMSTDFAEFIGKDQTVRSTRPVRVEGPGRIFTGEEGFLYRLNDETLDMTGQVKGVVKLDETR